MTDNLENTYYKKYLKYKAKYLDLVKRMRGGKNRNANYSACPEYKDQPHKDRPSYDKEIYTCEENKIKKRDGQECKTKMIGSECSSGSTCLKQNNNFTCQKTN